MDSPHGRPRDQTMTAGVPTVPDRVPKTCLDVRRFRLSSLQIETSKKELPDLKIELDCKRSPAVIEPYVASAADVHEF
jgi:hypothetical protein